MTRRMILKKLLIRSLKRGVASEIEFSKGMNVFTSTKNSVGKSSILKSILWGLGCDFNFDEQWDGLEPDVLISFSVDGADYQVSRRYGIGSFLRKNEEEFRFYEKITGGFAEEFAKIVKFGLLLEERDSLAMKVPPPAYYFLPFYIDQQVGWVKPWDGFKGLAQFAKWQDPVAQWHFGVATAEYFEIRKDVLVVRGRERVLEETISTVNSANDVIKSVLPADDIGAVTSDEFEGLKHKYLDKVREVKPKLEKTLTEIAALREELESSLVHLQIASVAVDELEEDYQFAEAQPEDLLCPTCGTHHSNDLVAKFEILRDKDSAEGFQNMIERDVSVLREALHEKTEEFGSLERDLKDAEQELNEISKRANLSREQVIGVIASKEVARVVERKVGESARLLLQEVKSREDLSKSASQILKERKAKISAMFFADFKDICARMDFFNINTDVRNLRSFEKMVLAGGSADKVRALLAYRLAVYSAIQRDGSEVLSPFFIDTPNQQDQSDEHYRVMLDEIRRCAESGAQVFLSAMATPAVNDRIISFAGVDSSGSRVFSLGSLSDWMNSGCFERVNSAFEGVSNSL